MADPTSNTFVQENLGLLTEWQNSHFTPGSDAATDAAGYARGFMARMDEASVPHERILDAVNVIGNYAEANTETEGVKAQLIQKTFDSYERSARMGASQDVTLMGAGVYNPNQFRSEQPE